MLVMVKLLMLAISITLSQARPQETVEAVTSLESLLDNSSLEASDIPLGEDEGNNKCVKL